jgi:hypothetical protein
VDYVAFQVAVIDLASKGVTLTVANVVAHLHVDPDRVEKLLDQMARDRRVDLEVDEAQGTISYRVRGLSTTTGRLLPDTHIATWQMPKRGHLRRHKSIMLAVALGGLFPGLGLVYAAPLRAVLLMSFVVLVMGNIFGAHEILGPVYWFAVSASSAFFGGVYAARFNQEGQRAQLNPTIRSFAK